MGVHESDVAADAGAVPTGRHFTTSVLYGVCDSEVVDAAEIVVTELLTNALFHGLPPVRLVVTVPDDGAIARIEVHDASRALPVRPRPSSDGMTGRGLALVAALSAGWGAMPSGRGKAVWAEITPDSVVGTEPDDVDLDVLLAGFDDDLDSGPARFTVTLGDVPTDLLLAAKAHVDSVVRELTLAATGAQSGVTGAVPSSLAVLVHDVVTQFAEARQAIKRQALTAAAKGEVRTTLQLTLPGDAAEAGERYLAALEEADSYARSSRLLTLAAPPQHAAFRRWYVTSLVEGLRRASDGEEAVVAPSFETYLLAEVDHLAELQEVSNRAARLQGVTASLAVVLGREEVTRIALDDAVAELGAACGVLLLMGGPAGVRVGATVAYAVESEQALMGAWLDGAPTPARVSTETGRAVWVESREDYVAQFPDIAALEPDISATCAVPLTVAGHLVGVLRLGFEEPRLFRTDERAFVSALAAVAAQALERADLYDARGSLADRLTRLQAVTSALAVTRSVDDVLDVTLRHATGLVGAQVASISLLRDGGPTIDLVRMHPAMPDTRWWTYDLHDPVPGAEAIRTGQLLWAPDLRERDARWPDIAATARDFDHSFAAIPMHAEGSILGVLTLSFAATDGGYEEPAQDFLMAFADVCAQALQRARAAEMATAARRLSETLQRSLLTRPPEPEHLAVAVRYVPASQEAQVGGDWYDAFITRDGSLNLVIGDCSGHDREAVAAMAAVRNLLRATAYAVEGEPAAVLSALEHTMAGLDVNALATALLARIEQTDEERERGVRSMVWANAGHLPPLLRHADGSTQVLHSTPDLMLGLLPSTERWDYRIELQPGATVLLYTDGLVERRGEDIDEGVERLRAVFERAGGLSLDDVCDTVLEQLGADAEDDVALLAVRFHDEASPRSLGY